MTDTVHRNLTGADLHEPKGVDTALAGQVYVSDGVGSGKWVAASDVIANAAWSTGDLKNTHKTTADSGWVLWSDGTIGDSSSGATIRANSDTSDLYSLYWNSYSNTICPVTGGRGLSAAADFAAHKPLAVPKGAGRAIGLKGAGSGLTSRSLGETTGAETVSIAKTNLPNTTFTFAGTAATITSSSTDANVLRNVRGLWPASTTGSSSYYAALVGSVSDTLVSTASYTPAGTVSSGGDGTALSIMQPTSFINVMIKL